MKLAKYKTSIIHRSRVLIKLILEQTGLQILAIFLFHVFLKNKMYKGLKEVIDEEFIKWRLIQ